MARVLVIDDSSAQRFMLTKSLKEGSHEVFAATNGEDGLAKINEHQPDFIISDLLMPVMDGVELLRQLRSDQNTTPVIIITANSNKQKIEEVKELGVTHILRKPCKQSELLSTLEQLKKGEAA